jgi:hypothetical protein
MLHTIRQSKSLDVAERFIDKGNPFINDPNEKIEEGDLKKIIQVTLQDHVNLIKTYNQMNNLVKKRESIRRQSINLNIDLVDQQKLMMVYHSLSLEYEKSYLKFQLLKQKISRKQMRAYQRAFLYFFQNLDTSCVEEIKSWNRLQLARRQQKLCRLYCGRQELSYGILCSELSLDASLSDSQDIKSFSVLMMSYENHFISIQELFQQALQDFITIQQKKEKACNSTYCELLSTLHSASFLPFHKLSKGISAQSLNEASFTGLLSNKLIQTIPSTHTALSPFLPLELQNEMLKLERDKKKFYAFRSARLKLSCMFRDEEKPCNDRMSFQDEETTLNKLGSELDNFKTDRLTPKLEGLTTGRITAIPKMTNFNQSLGHEKHQHSSPEKSSITFLTSTCTTSQKNHIFNHSACSMKSHQPLRVIPYSCPVSIMNFSCRTDSAVSMDSSSSSSTKMGKDKKNKRKILPVSDPVPSVSINKKLCTVISPSFLNSYGTSQTLKDHVSLQDTSTSNLGVKENSQLSLSPSPVSSSSSSSLSTGAFIDSDKNLTHLLENLSSCLTDESHQFRKSADEEDEEHSSHSKTLSDSCKLDSETKVSLECASVSTQSSISIEESCSKSESFETNQTSSKQAQSSSLDPDEERLILQAIFEAPLLSNQWLSTTEQTRKNSLQSVVQESSEHPTSITCNVAVSPNSINKKYHLIDKNDEETNDCLSISLLPSNENFIRKKHKQIPLNKTSHDFEQENPLVLLVPTNDSTNKRKSINAHRRVSDIIHESTYSNFSQTHLDDNQSVKKTSHLEIPEKKKDHNKFNVIPLDMSQSKTDACEVSDSSQYNPEYDTSSQTIPTNKLDILNYVFACLVNMNGVFTMKTRVYQTQLKQLLPEPRLGTQRYILQIPDPPRIPTSKPEVRTVKLLRAFPDTCTPSCRYTDSEGHYIVDLLEEFLTSIVNKVKKQCWISYLCRNVQVILFLFYYRQCSC